MNNRLGRIFAAVALFGAFAVPAVAQDSMSGGSMSSMKDPMVGGAAMYPSKNIIQNAVNSKDHTTLVTLVKDAGLVATLSGPGPFTVFAPTNEAFAKLPPATVAAVQEPKNKKLLTSILTYHVVAGKVDSKELAAKIQAGGGTATLKTVNGEDLKASMDGDKIVLTDAKGGKAYVTIADVYQSNGVIHVIDSVLMP
jgi:uncharacterized surface protein with fasciclin (FAS1) repeats